MINIKSIIEKCNRRRLVLAILLLIAPLLAAIFWVFGGGKGTAARTEDSEMAGLNPDLPKAHFNDDEAWDKLSLYEKAKRDSMRFNEAKRNDPYFRLDLFEVADDTLSEIHESGRINSSLGKKDHTIDASEKILRVKLNQLNDHIRNVEDGASSGAGLPIRDKAGRANQDVAQLESMMEMMHGDMSSDPEMKEINDVLGKILDIQHPERVKQRTKDLKKSRVSYAAEPFQKDDVISLISNTVDTVTDPIDINAIPLNGFFGIANENSYSQLHNSIAARVYDDQTLVSGSFAKLIIEQDVEVNGIVIPQNEFAYGVCSLNGERLTIEVNSLRRGNSILPVSLTAYDLDGIEGIYVPGAMARDAAKQTSDQTLQSLQLGTLDPSLEVQAANAGLEAAKGLLSKKSKMIRVTIKAGHRVLLRDVNTNQNIKDHEASF